MIERLYLDNIRSFANFEWKPGRLALLLGSNGTGKTALLDALGALQRFVNGEASAEEAFPDASRTRWDTRTEQAIEVDVRIGASVYRYRLVVTHDADGVEEPTVVRELLECDDVPVLEFTKGDLWLFRNGSGAQIAGAKATRSSIGALAARPGDPLARFQDWALTKLWLLRPDPRAMSGRIDRRRVGKAPWLEPSLSNFAAWYLPTFTSKPASMFKASVAIAEALPGFVELFEFDGELAARFDRQGVTSVYRFQELSDGERALIALYVLLHAVAAPGTTLVLDEPDNYLALREVQPWLAALTERALRADGPQVILISHHPDPLNFLAVEKGWRMFRDRTGPSRVERFEPAEGLDPGGTIARGWDQTE